MTAITPAEGTRLADRFVIRGTLGSGGMGSVLDAVDEHDGRAVAIKVMKPELRADEPALARFRREARTLAGLTHPGIVDLVAFGELDDGSLYIAMERVAGETLRQRIARGALSAPEANAVFGAACAALAAAHDAGVVHRDLKPSNMLLTGDSDAPVKLVDFGVARGMTDTKMTATGSVPGTPRYLPPERLLGDSDLDARGDIYAMGVVLYEALTARSPFPSRSDELVASIVNGWAVPLGSIRPDLPVEVEAVVARAMARRPEGRFASATELAEALDAAARGVPGPAPESTRDLRVSTPANDARLAKTVTSPTQATPPPPATSAPAGDDGRSRLPLVLVAVVVLLGLLGAGGWAWSSGWLAAAPAPEAEPSPSAPATTGEELVPPTAPVAVDVPPSEADEPATNADTESAMAATGDRPPATATRRTASPATGPPTPPAASAAQTTPAPTPASEHPDVGTGPIRVKVVVRPANAEIVVGSTVIARGSAVFAFATPNARTTVNIRAPGHQRYYGPVFAREAPQRNIVLIPEADTDGNTPTTMPITSHPTGATVFRDGTRLGETPLVVPRVECGTRARFEIALDGYHRERRDLQCGQRRWNVQLRPLEAGD